MKEGIVGWIFGGRAKSQASGTAAPALADSVQAVTADPIGEIRHAKPSVGVRILPRFQTMAYDELVRSSDLISHSRLRLRKAFTPSQPVRDRWMFAGRSALLTRIISAIEDQRLHVVIYGPRGIGKTSVARALSEIAADARYQTIYISCDTTASFDQLFRAIAAAVALMYHEAYGPTSAEAERGGTFADLLSSSPISVSAASELFSQLVGAHLLIVLDEFDRCRVPEFRRDVAEFLKNLSDQAVGAQLVIAGVAKDLEEMIAPDPMIQRNILAVEVPRMDATEVGQLLANGEEISGLSFDALAGNKIMSASVGLPYLATLLAQHASLAALAAGRLSVSKNDVSIAIDAAIKEIGERMPKRSLMELRRCSLAGEIGYLACLAQFSQTMRGEVSVDDLVFLFQDTNERAEAHNLLARLAANGEILCRVGDEPRFRFVDEGILPFIGLLSAQTETSVGKPSETAGALSPRSPAH